MRAGDSLRRELFDAYRRGSRAPTATSGAFLWTAPRTRRAPGRGRPARRRARWRSRISSAPRACRPPPPRASSRATGRSTRPPRSRRLARRRRADARQDEHGRVRDGLVDRELRASATPQSVGPGARAGRLERRLGGGRRRGLAPWAIGTDTGGSIRQPAALCGIVGLKPTYGAVSRYGLVAFASSLDQVGPLTRTVTDAALLLDAIVGHDPCDSTSLGLPEPVRLPDAAATCDGLRIGVPDGALERRASSRAWPSVFDRDAGPRCERARRRGRGGRAAARAARHRRLLPDRAGRGVDQPGALRRRALRHCGPDDGDAARAVRATRAREGFGAEVKRRIMLGTYALSAGYYDAYYGTRAAVRTQIADDFRERVRAAATCVVTPTSPTVAFKLGETHRRPARDVPVRLLHGADVPGRHPGHLDLPAGLVRRACRSASRSRARRSPRTASSTPRTRSSRRSGSTRRGRCVAR